MLDLSDGAVPYLPLQRAPSNERRLFMTQYETYFSEGPETNLLSNSLIRSCFTVVFIAHISTQNTSSTVSDCYKRPTLDDARYTILHYTTLLCTELHYITIHCYTLHYTTHHTTLHYRTLPYATLHYTTLHHTTLHYTTLHCTRLD